MAILEEQVREENPGVTEEEAEEIEEVKEAESDQAMKQEAFGGGLDHQTLMRYDQMAHSISHAIAGHKLVQAEHKVRDHWDPIHHQNHDDWSALVAIESIKAHTITPVLQKIEKEARADLEQKATDLIQSGVALEGKSRDEIKEDFCGRASKEVTGAEYHPVAVEVYEQLIAPVAKEPEAEQEKQEIQDEQQGKAEEQIEEQEEKQSA